MTQKANEWCNVKAKEKRAKLTELENELETLIEKQCYSNLDVQPRHLIIKEQIENIYAERTRYSMFRSKVRWYGEGEKSTKYYFRLEKQRFNHKAMTVLIR